MAFTNEEKKLLYWQLAVEGMDILNIPDGEYEAAQKRGKYDRFTTFVKEFAEKLLGKSNTGVEFFSDTQGLPFFNDGELKEGWWQQAVDLGRGKIPKNIILPIIHEPSEETIKAVYSTFMPAYRALTESFAKRSIFQWIFNHAQYTAERDAIRGLRGLMMCLTAKTSEELKPHLDNYREKGPSVVRTFEERKALLARMRAGEEVNAYEDEVLLMPENINERMQDQESISVNESENRNNNIVVENNNIIENNIDLENEQIVFDPDDIDNGFSYKSNDPFENDDVEKIQSIVNDININEPVLNILGNDNNIEDEKDSSIENDNSEDEEYSFENEDNKLSDEINRFSNGESGNGLGEQGNEEVQEVPKEYRPSAKVIFERATRPVEFKQEAIAFIRDLLKDFNVSEDLINEIYVQATEQCSDICNSYDTQVAGDDQDGIADVMGSTASSTFGLLHYTIKDSDLNIVDRLVISQKLTDYFIHKLTPIGFNPEEFGKYGENFMLNYRDAITDNVVENYEEDEISREDCEKAIDDAIKALGANAPQIEEEVVNNEENNNENNDEVKENESEKSIVNEQIVEEPIVEEPPKEEQPKEDVIVSEEHVKESIPEPVEEPIVEEPIVENNEEKVEEINEVKEDIQQPKFEEENHPVEEPIVEEPIVEQPVVEPVKQEPIVQEQIQQNNASDEPAKSSVEKKEIKMTEEQIEALNTLSADKDFFLEKYNELIDEGTALETVKTEIAAALKNSNVFEEEEIENFLDGIDAIYDHIPNTYEYYFEQDRDRLDRIVHTMVEVTIGLAYDNLNLYNVRDRGMDMIAQFKLSQEITDVVMKYLSPIPFTRGAYDQFANGYGLRSRHIVSTLLGSAKINKRDQAPYIEKITGRSIEEEQPQLFSPLTNLTVSKETEERLKKAAEEERKNAEKEIKEEIKEEPAPPKEPEPVIEKEPEPEIEIDDPVDDVPELPSWITDINNNFKDQCSERIGDSTLTAEVRNQLNDIINAPRSGDAGIKKAINQVNKIPAEMLDLFELADVDMRSAQGMESMTAAVFKEAFSRLATCNYKLPDRLVMAQKITDVMMKNYSTIAFLPNEVDGYADNYVLRNENLLKEVLSDSVLHLSAQDVSAMIEYVKVSKDKLLEGFDAREQARLNANEFMNVQKEGDKYAAMRLKDTDNIQAEIVISFKDQCELKLDNSEHTQDIKKELAEILSEAGVDQASVDTATDIAFDTLLRDLMKNYNALLDSPERLNTVNTFMENITNTLVASAYKCTSKYISDKAESMYAAQKIADKFSLKYGPAAFTNNKTIDDYAKKHVISDGDKTRKIFDRVHRDEKIGDEEFNKVFATIDARRIKERDEELAKAEEKRIKNEAERAKKQEELAKQKEANASEKKEEPEKKEEKVGKKPRKKVEKKAPRNVVEKYERNVNRMDVSNKDIMHYQDITALQNECVQSVKDANLTKYVKAQIENILADAGVEESKIEKFADRIIKTVTGEGMHGVVNTYSYIRTANSHKPMTPAGVMKYAAEVTAKNLIMNTSECYANPVDGLLANQKILDVLLKNYSPMAFTNGNLEKTVENFMIKDQNILQHYHSVLAVKVKGFEKEEDFYKSVKEAYEEATDQEIEDNAPDQNIKAEENKEAKAEIQNDPEANKVKIVVKELAETGASNDVSAQIEDDSKSVASQKQM